MVNVYKTNVTDSKLASDILSSLSLQLPGSKINFDLEDCDRILRVEGQGIDSSEIIDILNKQGFYCNELPD